MRTLLFLFSVLVANATTAADFQSAWEGRRDRVWVGPHYFANRLYDWRLKEGRVECLEGSRAKPMRTLHLLDYAAGEGPGTIRMQVRTGLIRSGGPRIKDTWSGFLIGVGGEHVGGQQHIL